jgi:hypothetical protein
VDKIFFAKDIARLPQAVNKWYGEKYKILPYLCLGHHESWNTEICLCLCRPTCTLKGSFSIRFIFL